MNEVLNNIYFPNDQEGYPGGADDCIHVQYVQQCSVCLKIEPNVAQAEKTSSSSLSSDQVAYVSQSM